MISFEECDPSKEAVHLRVATNVSGRPGQRRFFLVIAPRALVVVKIEQCAAKRLKHSLDAVLITEGPVRGKTLLGECDRLRSTPKLCEHRLRHQCACLAEAVADFPSQCDRL